MGSKYSTGENLVRQITTWSVICIVVTFVSLVSVAAWMARSHDAEASRVTRDTVVGVVETARLRLADAINDDTWDEVYRAYDRGDRAWLDAHLGSTVNTGESVDAALIASRSGEVRTSLRG